MGGHIEVISTALFLCPSAPCHSCRHDVVLRVVAIAVKMVMAMCRIFCQIDFVSISFSFSFS